MAKRSDYSGFALLFFLFSTTALFLTPEAVYRLKLTSQTTGEAEQSVQQQAEAAQDWRRLELEATAYNSLEAQTDSTPDIAAWGDKLKPGMKSIAVSRDLLKMGLKRGTRVKISGLEGEYVVLDKMNKRWKKRIDVYMGEDVKAALKFGKKQVTLSYRPKSGLLVADNGPNSSTQ